MNSRDRFNRTMAYKKVDRPPLFEDGVRSEVLRSWRSQGLGKKEKLDDLFSYDKREEIEPDLEPCPAPTRWPTSDEGLRKLAQRLDPEDPTRLPGDWEAKLQEWKSRDYPLILRLHRGYFLSMGVHGWHRFTDAIRLLKDDPRLVENWMDTYAEFSAQLARKILSKVSVDAVLFSEPIGGNHGPLISPQMYASFVVRSFQPILEIVRQYGISTIIYRTYANTRVLLPIVVEAGFNCLWACEVNPQAMEYGEIRKEYGKDLRLIGGIDSDCLRQNQREIYRTVMDVVPRLLEQGGFIPLADGRVRADVTYENYAFYRKLLDSLTSKSS